MGRLASVWVTESIAGQCVACAGAIICSSPKVEKKGQSAREADGEGGSRDGAHGATWPRTIPSEVWLSTTPRFVRTETPTRRRAEGPLQQGHPRTRQNAGWIIGAAHEHGLQATLSSTYCTQTKGSEAVSSAHRPRFWEGLLMQAPTCFHVVSLHGARTAWLGGCGAVGTLMLYYSL